MDDLRDNPLAGELLAEMAASYFRTAKNMQAALVALRTFEQECVAARMEVEEKRDRREQLMAEAAEQVWFFVNQREAMKMHYYEEMFADFEIPEEVRRRMGPKKM